MADAASFMFLSRRNDSFIGSAGQVVVASFAALTLGIAIFFAAQGAWVMLLFAAIDILVLQIASGRMHARAKDFDLVRVFGDEVEVTVRRQQTCRSFRCHRRRVRMDMLAAAGGEPGWIVLRSQDGEVAFGAHLSREQRVRLASDLGRQLSAPPSAGALSPRRDSATPQLIPA